MDIYKKVLNFLLTTSKQMLSCLKYENYVNLIQDLWHVWFVMKERISWSTRILYCIWNLKFRETGSSHHWIHTDNCNVWEYVIFFCMWNNLELKKKLETLFFLAKLNIDIVAKFICFTVNIFWYQHLPYLVCMKLYHVCKRMIWSA